MRSMRPFSSADDLRLGGLEVHRAARAAVFEQRAVHLVQMDQVRHQFTAPLRLGAARVAEDRRHLGVGEARLRADHRRVELVGGDRAVAIDHHVAHHRQPVLFGVERAQPVGQFLRQHRDHAARKVHRGGTLVRVVVDRLAGLHVVADVGDRHHQAPTRVRVLAAPQRLRLAIHRIVEVACILAVDGDQRHVAQVDALPPVDRAHVVWQRGGLRQRLGREAVRHFVLAHRDLDLHARVVDLAEHLDHAAHRLREHRRRLGQFHRHHLSGGGRGRGVLRDQDVLAVAPVLWRHQPHAVFVQQAADDRGLAPLDDVEHVPFGAALAVVAHDAHLHAVAVQHRMHLLLRQVDVGLAVVALHKAVAVAVTDDGAANLAHQCTAQRRTDGLFQCLDAKILRS